MKRESKPQSTVNQKLSEEIKRTAAVVRRGGVILYPTDTVWGIGCDATNPEAVRKVYEIKQRADNKAMIVLVPTVDDVTFYVEEFPEVAEQLIEYSEKPITIVYDKGIRLAPELMGEDGTVGIRVTKEEFSNSLCRLLRRPLVSTSANISGQPAPALFPEISQEILDAVDYVVDYRRDDLMRHAPSTVMRLSAGGEFKILRP